MTGLPENIAPGMILGLALLAVSACRVAAPVPPAPLVAAVQALIVDSLRPQATAAGVQFTVVPDTDGTWARALATTARPSETRQPTLELHLGRAALRADSAIVDARLVGCTPAVRGMNFFIHYIRLRFLRTDGEWSYRGRTTDLIADGECGH